MDFESQLCIKVALLLLPLFVIGIRLLWVLPAVSSPTIESQKEKGLSQIPSELKGSNIMVFLGSGGHTGEMMRILTNVDLNNFNRTWVTSSGDTTSILKCKKYEDDRLRDSKYKLEYLILHRARSVGESIILSIFSTTRSFISTIKSLYDLTRFPSILLLNGPGTSVPLAYIIFLLKFLGFCKTKIIYIESLARVEQLSLSGILILPIADRLIVQWKQLALKYKRAEYYGILI
ncbi:UDP-N-acetylglucosamine transferase subunit ALG14 [Debaryomyces fabryi]|uniref:UDP-N-acetylglucosamine transferase subunit ALG14 n=1 Tax=Debaryomyces fabryi TaxID=58627 RepID=A0A0V1PX64_9ASCO|nr:UDP-N-acetylglucosamine transferase subunit ALG14 [Debaryomyces fabryi]KSA00859.1 UDP-N-acetylglucosamine transferase subunit ALG14 [Debaryomyces fabryi]CUM45523.1 unnamed protein product [Debaryomyces fabryi]